MAYRILKNQERQSVSIHSVSTTSGIVIAGNNSVSNVATGSEVIESASIRKAIWGTSNNAHWEVVRGANTVLVFGADGTADLSAMGNAVELDGAATLTITLANGSAGDGFLILELAKKVAV